ncbi:MAG: hypothetical protein C3F11_19165 [Methylocystaceae bacterium]|nr:MAG: hypothetical protein C3F11_19165 [Methylocystaceae bacterium]
MAARRMSREARQISGVEARARDEQSSVPSRVRVRQERVIGLENVDEDAHHLRPFVTRKRRGVEAFY